jgi:hypothetical protein
LAWLRGTHDDERRLGIRKDIYILQGLCTVALGHGWCMSMTWNNRCDGIHAESRPTILEHDDMNCLYSRYRQLWQLHTHIPPESMVREDCQGLRSLAGFTSETFLPSVTTTTSRLVDTTQNVSPTDTNVCAMMLLPRAIGLM